MELEPGAKFAHVAVRYGEYWFHAHSHKGVDLIRDNELLEYGYQVTILHEPHLTDPTDHVVSQWLGKPFDFKYSWNRSDATYCTKLVVDALNLPIRPRPMKFRSTVWKSHMHKSVGEPGLSPDELYEELLENFKFTKVAELCESALSSPGSR